MDRFISKSSVREHESLVKNKIQEEMINGACSLTEPLIMNLVQYSSVYGIFIKKNLPLNQFTDFNYSKDLKN